MENEARLERVDDSNTQEITAELADDIFQSMRKEHGAVNGRRATVASVVAETQNGGAPQSEGAKTNVQEEVRAQMLRVSNESNIRRLEHIPFSSYVDRVGLSLFVRLLK